MAAGKIQRIDSAAAKANELRKALANLGKRLDDGDQSELLVWVIPASLACAHRPLRHHPKYGGSRRDLSPDAAGEVRDNLISVLTI